MRNTKFQKRKKMMILTIIIILTISTIGIRPLTETTIIAKVTGKERVTDSNGKGSKYLIYTDEETIECTDEKIYLKFNSSDMYGKIHKDSTYKFTVVGWRIPLFSMYRNIVKIEKNE